MQGFCENCVYWIVDKPEYLHELGHCHRYPPRFLTEHLSKFPETSGNCFCGEWKLTIKFVCPKVKGGD